MGETKQLYDYPSCVLSKGEKRITFIYCEGTGRIVESISESLNPDPFRFTMFDWQIERLLLGGWKVEETIGRTEIV